MTEEKQSSLQPGKHFPADRRAPDRDAILEELRRFGYEAQGEIRLIDSSHGADDIRLNYVVDRRWVLRYCNAPEMTERRMAELNRLIGRYRDFGLRCPAFLPDSEGRFFHAWEGLQCYLAEYVDLRLLSELPEQEREEGWQEVLDSVALFAERYKNVDLSEIMGMYSLFDLSPFDKPLGIDEKQQNLNSLLAALRESGETALAAKLETRNAEVRGKLLAVYRGLPRCVFQGDENASNVLIDEKNHLAGLIDFNLAGTEVVVNQFANLGGGFDEEVKEPEGAALRLAHALDSYSRYQGRMLRLYRATEQERLALGRYTWIALAAGWPQVCFFLDGLKSEALRPEILELLGLLAELPEEALLLRGEDCPWSNAV